MTTPPSINPTSEQLAEQARCLHRVLNDLPQHHAVTDTLDYILGALYALNQARQIGFNERPTAYVSEYHPHLANYALQVAASKPPHESWVAGFYFNSGIQRLAAAFDRLPKMLGAADEKTVDGKKRRTSAKDRMTEINSGNWKDWERVYDEVNAFKHSPEGRAAGRTVTMDDAVAASTQVLDLLTRNKAELIRRFGP